MLNNFNIAQSIYEDPKILNWCDQALTRSGEEV